jgi:hypothetical protein
VYSIGGIGILWMFVGAVLVVSVWSGVISTVSVFYR